MADTPKSEETPKVVEVTEQPAEPVIQHEQVVPTKQDQIPAVATVVIAPSTEVPASQVPAPQVPAPQVPVSQVPVYTPTVNFGGAVPVGTGTPPGSYTPPHPVGPGYPVYPSYTAPGVSYAGAPDPMMIAKLQAEQSEAYYKQEKEKRKEIKKQQGKIEKRHAKVEKHQKKAAKYENKIAKVGGYPQAGYPYGYAQTPVYYPQPGYYPAPVYPHPVDPNVVGGSPLVQSSSSSPIVPVAHLVQPIQHSPEQAHADKPLPHTPEPHIEAIHPPHVEPVPVATQPSAQPILVATPTPSSPAVTTPTEQSKSEPATPLADGTKSC